MLIWFRQVLFWLLNIFFTVVGAASVSLRALASIGLIVGFGILAAWVVTGAFRAPGSDLYKKYALERKFGIWGTFLFWLQILLIAAYPSLEFDSQAFSIIKIVISAGVLAMLLSAFPSTKIIAERRKEERELADKFRKVNSRTL